MKILALLLLSTVCYGQNILTLQDGTKLIVPDVWSDALLIDASTPKDIQFAEGTEVKFVIIHVKGGGKTIRIGEATTPAPAPLKVEAESHTFIQNAAVVGTIIGNMRGDLPGGVNIKYPAVSGKTKVKFRYSRGYPNSGNMTLKIGTTSHTLFFLSTNDWGTYQEIEFNISGSGVVELTSSEIGAMNFDYMTFQ